MCCTSPFRDAGERHLKLLFVSPYPPRRGGTAASLLQLTLALQQRGHGVRVLAPITADHTELDRTFAESLGSLRLTRYLVPYFLYSHSSVPFDEHYRACEREAIRSGLPALIEAERPDVIVAGVEPLAWYVPEIAAEHRIPCVLLLRGGPTWKIVDGTYPELVGREWLTAFRRADRIVAVARHLEEGLRRLEVENICSIPNHVDLGRFAPHPKDPELLRELHLGPDQVVVLHAAQTEPRKRSLDVVMSAASVLRDCPDVAYVIAGEGSLRGELEATCGRLQVAKRFRFPGWVPYERMPALFNLADVVVQPSEREGLARVYLEAMACERVLVASDIPPAREVVRHGENGLLFETGNVEALASATLLAARDPELRSRLGREARASIAAHSLDRVTDEFVALFEDVRRASQA